MFIKVFINLEFFFTPVEKAFVSVIALLSSFIFAYSMNSIGEILKEMGRKES
jgi:C4-dicarboxylate transporter